MTYWAQELTRCFLGLMVRICVFFYKKKIGVLASPPLVAVPMLLRDGRKELIETVGGNYIRV